jgi:hypothetical protein
MADQPVASTSPESTSEFLGKSTDPINLVARLVSIHQHQQQQALTSLQGAIQLQGAGFPVDTKAIMKFAKKAKLPIETNPENLKAWLASQMDAKGGKDTSGGQAQGQQGGGGPAQAPDGASESHKMAIDMANRLKAGQKVSPEEIASVRIKAMGEAMLKANNTAAATEQQKAENGLQVESLKSQAMAGDKAAVGKLMAGGGIPFNFEQAKWNAASESQRADAMDVWAGHESKGEFAARATRIGDSLTTSGRVTDPAAAYKIGNIIASGGTVPAELQSKMKPYTFKELADSAGLMGDLVQLGVPPDRVGKVASAAMTGGLENALPTGMKPLAVQELALKRQEVGMEGTRTKIELARYEKEVASAERMDYLASLKAKSDEAKAALDSFKSLVEIKKAGGKVDEDIIRGASVKAANALGMDAEEVNSTFHFLTGGTDIKFKPRLTEQGSATVKKFSGGQNKTPEPSDLQKIINTVRNRGKKQEPI